MSNEPADDRLAKLGARLRTRERTDAESARKRAENNEIRSVTIRAVALASYAKREHAGEPDFDSDAAPIGLRDVRITLDELSWARKLIVAAAAWKAWPGFKVLTEAPVPGAGEGYEAGRIIFEEASNPGATEARVAKLLAAARAELGVATSDRNHGRTELGLWNYFRSLGQYLDTSGWHPPTISTGTDAQPREKVRDRSGRVTLDVKTQVVLVDDKEFHLGPEATRILRLLLEAQRRDDGITWTSGKRLKKKQNSTERPDRIIDRMPPPVRALIEGRRSAGYRLVWNKSGA
jgi:hypothetical protein